MLFFSNIQSTDFGVFFGANVYKKYKYKPIFLMINSKIACFYLIYVQNTLIINTY